MSRPILSAAAILAATTAMSAAPLHAAVANGGVHHSAITILAPHFVTERTLGGLGDVRTPTVSSIVHYGDLDLHTRAGRHRLEYRVDEAAEKVCARIDRIDPANASDPLDRACVDHAIISARPQVAAAIARKDDQTG